MWGDFLFAVLELVPFQKEKHFWKRWRQKVPEPEIEAIPVRGGAYFYIVKAFLDKNGNLDEDGLQNNIGNAIYRVILKEGSALPQNTKLREFTPTLYPTILFLNTALAYLKETENQKRERALGILDVDAKLLDSILPFAPLAKSITVCTNAPQAYEVTAKRMLEQYGLPLQMTHESEKLEKCSLLLEPFYSENGKALGRILLQRGMRDAFRGEDIDLPTEILKRCPENIDKVLFASALYENCNVKTLKNLPYARRKRIKAL